MINNSLSVQNKETTVGSTTVYLVALISIVIWGSVYSITRVTLQYVSPVDLAFLRLAIASVFLLPYALVTRTKIPEKKHWKCLFIIGAVGFSSYTLLLNLGQRAVEAGTANFVISTTPIIAACLAVIFLKEKLKFLEMIGFLLSVVGIFFILLGHGENIPTQYSSALIILLGAAVVHAIHFVIQKVSLRDLSPLQVTLCSMIVGAVLLFPFAPFAIKNLLTMPTNIIYAVIFLGIFPSALAHLMWAFVVQNLPVSIATGLLNLITPMAVLIGVIWLDEKLTPFILSGGMLILMAVILIQTRRRIDSTKKILKSTN